jgi:hypothetical protein
MYKLAVALTALSLIVVVPNHSYARDDGRFANSPLKEWFDRLASRNGLCCAFADGVSVQDVDWDTQDGHYRVRIPGEWIVVPDAAVVTEPNRFGPAVVWPYNDRCTHKFAASCLVPARSRHLTAAISERTWRSASGTQRIPAPNYLFQS